MTVEKGWNDRLAPHARTLGGERHIARWLRWAKQLDDEYRAEVVMVGLASLRDTNKLPWLRSGEHCTPGALDTRHEGQAMIHAAEAEGYKALQPKGRSGDMERLGA